MINEILELPSISSHPRFQKALELFIRAFLSTANATVAGLYAVVITIALVIQNMPMVFLSSAAFVLIGIIVSTIIIITVQNSKRLYRISTYKLIWNMDGVWIFQENIGYVYSLVAK